MMAQQSTFVEAINRGRELAVLSDGQAIPVAAWLDQEGETIPDTALAAVCGPCAAGHWYAVALSEFTAATRN